MNPGQRRKAIHEFGKFDRLPREEFYIWGEAIERWKKEGLPDDYEARNLFNFDPQGWAGAGLFLGWCEPPFSPFYEDKTIKDEGQTEIIQDFAGRQLRVFKNRRHGFMPTYVRNPVTCMKDWEEEVKPRLNPADPSRYAGMVSPSADFPLPRGLNATDPMLALPLKEKCRLNTAKREKEDIRINQGIIGGYMYLRALMGPEDLCYAFVEQPELIHAMMKQWAGVMDAGLAAIQANIELDEVEMAEDICYKGGLLISPEMIHTFLFPYYRQVLEGARARQKRKLFFYLDTDGMAYPAVPLYLEIGVNGMGPWEVAAGCDVVEAGQRWPKLMLLGGIDKRVLAMDKAAIEAHLQHVMPSMVRRGGYIPTCDHGVPDNVSLENYLYYRQRMCELDH